VGREVVRHRPPDVERRGGEHHQAGDAVREDWSADRIAWFCAAQARYAGFSAETRAPVAVTAETTRVGGARVAPINEAFKMAAAKERQNLRPPIQVIVMCGTHRDEVRNIRAVARAINSEGSNRDNDVSRGGDNG
jgi:hypothetical protein